MTEAFSIQRLYGVLAKAAQSGRWAVRAQPTEGQAQLEVESVLRLPAGDHPEGVAVDRSGNVYVSNRRYVETRRQSEILKIDLDKHVMVVARLPDTSDPKGNGVLGLGTDRHGNIYAALDSRDPASRGVWRIAADGSQTERLPGSERMTFPNALTFDVAGNLYATDSETGTIWRFTSNASAEGIAWAQDELLAPFPFDPFGIPLPTGEIQPFSLPGANGIAFYPPNHLYVANTEKAMVVHIPIEADGGAGKARRVAGEPIPGDMAEWVPDPRLWTIDGIAVDHHGEIHGVIAGCAVVSRVTGRPPSPLVRINPVTGGVEAARTTTEAFHVPLSLAFGRSARDRSGVFVTNSALLAELFPGAGPGLIRGNVGVRGFDVDEV